MLQSIHQAPKAHYRNICLAQNPVHGSRIVNTNEKTIPTLGGEDDGDDGENENENDENDDSMDYSWLNESLESFKVKCKKLLLE